MITLITGAGSGIGKAIAKRLFRLGHSLLLVGRSENKLETLRTELQLNETVNKIEIFSCDLENAQECTSLYINLIERQIIPDTIVITAGTYSENTISELDAKEMTAELNRNFFTALNSIHPWISDFKKRNSGNILVVSSILAHEQRPSAAGYSLSKTLLHSYTNMLARELRTDNVKVSLITPGSVNTPSWDGIEAPIELFPTSDDIASSVEHVLTQPKNVWVEEIIIRPVNPNW